MNSATMMTSTSPPNKTNDPPQPPEIEYKVFGSFSAEAVRRFFLDPNEPVIPRTESGAIEAA